MDPLQQPALTRKGAREDALSDKETLREEAGCGTEVSVGIAVPLRVELDLAVVEVEVRSVIEAVVRVRILSPPVRGTEARKRLAPNEARSCS
jgi:hypothetical protein